MGNETVRISPRLEDLIGVGLEYLVDRDGIILAKFVDGNLMNIAEIQPNSEITEVTDNE